MRRIELEELKQLQLDILSDVHEFCIQSNIKYSLAFGTLLGAVRHEGYIPWDDDIDIMMPRKDYEIFLKMYGNERFQIANHNTMSSCHLPYSKVYDVRTLVSEYSEYPMDYGVNIDVFPLDNVPDSEVELKSFLKKKEFWNIIYDLKKIKISKRRSFIKNVVLAFAHILFFPISIHFVSQKMRNLSIKYFNVPTKRIGIVAPSDNNIREIWDRETFAEYAILPFENVEVMVMKNYHDFLTAAYGNYMQLPPKDKRISHHVFTALWKDKE